MSESVLYNKTAVITGAASGIGFATAEEFLKSGVSKVLLLDIAADLSPTQYAQLKTCNPKADVSYRQCDVTNKQLVEKIFRQDAMKLLGSIDILVNSAGIFECEPAKCVGINLIGLMDCTLIAMDLMTKEKNGKGGFIVNISSIGGLEPYPVAAVYTGTKFGVTGFTRALGTELVYNKTGIKLAAICPSATKTNIRIAAGRRSSTFPWMKEAAEELIKKYPVQQASAVGKCIVKVIAEGETGSAWYSAVDTITQVKFEPNKYV
ncbi:alcohol dehydrogenase 2-like [Sabethes cyaneus]|uniref:alcohol dehydrogenase 2-like n=1 Tax=Sabethes cyaneus TaxID=53552 RepID=UPI00237E9AD2|nr:alcohol dehydrogenase 2-like [Sabethes cyaneus]